MTEHNSNPIPKKVKDITGRKFGRTTVVGFAFVDIQGARWNCVCDCGETHIARANGLKGGNIQSCGCLQKERQRATVRKTHGKTNSRVYKIWAGMKARCYSPRASGYDRYGGRGITVCDRWRNSFEAFYQDMGEPPNPKHSIERRDNNGDYSLENCYWATGAEQMNNTRANRLVEFNGETLTLAEWGDRMGISPALIRDRIERGWSVKDALVAEKMEPHSITFRNESHTIKEWAKILNIKHRTLIGRLSLGWSIERAFTEPIRKVTVKKRKK